MSKETMSSEERIWCAINLEKPDRVPIHPLLTPITAAKLTGRTQKQIVGDDFEGLKAMFEVFDNFGPFDAINTMVLTSVKAYDIAGWQYVAAGQGLEEDEPAQMHEQELLELNDYDIIADIGMVRFLTEELISRPWNKVKTQGDYFNIVLETQALNNAYIAECRKKGCYPIPGAQHIHPFFYLSLSRSMVKFTEDIYYHPDKVEKAIKRMITETAEALVEGCKESGVPIAWFVEERAGGFFYPLKVFERFWWPYAKQLVDILWSENIVTYFHLDTCWDKNLPYFKELPRKSSIIDLDSTTDIFRAKEILDDHLCISTDVPAALLSLGNSEEVETYCKKLIDQVGGNGGMILSSGCEVPYACKPTNLRAMIETGKTYEFSNN